jgi:hypothetical protein
VESNWVHSALRPPIGLLCQPRVIMTMERLVEWLAGETKDNRPTCRSLIQNSRISSIYYMLLIYFLVLLTTEWPRSQTSTCLISAPCKILIWARAHVRVLHFLIVVFWVNLLCLMPKKSTRQHWNWRLYITEVMIRHDSPYGGLAVALAMFSVINYFENVSRSTFVIILRTNVTAPRNWSRDRIRIIGLCYTKMRHVGLLIYYFPCNNPLNK